MRHLYSAILATHVAIGSRASSPGDAIRSFVAFDIDPAVRTALRALQTAFLDTHADVRWVRAEGLHVTLKFLGAVEPARLEVVHTALVAALADQPPLRLTVRGLGAFPAWRRARVVWVGLAGEGLIELAACAERTLTGLGFPAEGRPFTPHLTIGRVNSPRGWPRLEELIDGPPAGQLWRQLRRCRHHLPQHAASLAVQCTPRYGQFR